MAPSTYDNYYAGYNQTLEKIKEMSFDPTCNLQTQIYDCIKERLIHIKKAKISKNDNQERFLVLTASLDVPIDGKSYPLPIHIMLNENTFPNFYPIVQVDLGHPSLMYNPECSEVLSNGCVYFDMFKKWDKHYTIAQSLQEIQSIFKRTYPVCKADSSSTGNNPPLPDNLKFIVEMKDEYKIPIITFDNIVQGTCLGEGAFAKVYAGSYKGQEVALKVLNICPRNKDLIALKREVIIQSQMKHPNIVQIYGLSYKGDKPVIVMEMGGETLRKLIDSRKKEDIAIKTDEWRLRMCKEIASAIQYMHKRNLIHRDIKSENVLLSHGTCKLTDFGLSREEDRDTRMTFCGTPAGMAPELLRKETYNEKVDIYSFAILMYEIYTELRPYEDCHLPDVTILRNIAYVGLRPTLPSHLSPAIKDIIKACWAAKPADRLSVDEIIAKLNAL
ncbi:hypothetical protein WA158_004129 [Blastocystis sp. Blastoise]